MTFEEWLNATMTANHNDLQPNEAAEMGWKAGREELKKEIFNILQANILVSSKEGNIIYPHVIDKIEKL